MLNLPAFVFFSILVVISILTLPFGVHAFYSDYFRHYQNETGRKRDNLFEAKKVFTIYNNATFSSLNHFLGLAVYTYRTVTNTSKKK